MLHGSLCSDALFFFCEYLDVKKKFVWLCTVR